MLTDEVTRLCAEIGDLRRQRRALRTDLAQATQDRAATVSEMQAGLLRARAEMARKMRTGLVAFTSRLRKEVGDQGRGIRADIAGARRAWCGRKAFRTGD